MRFCKRGTVGYLISIGCKVKGHQIFQSIISKGIFDIFKDSKRFGMYWQNSELTTHQGEKWDQHSKRDLIELN